ncbi:hypothetical protein [Tomitella fengzijianii]|uniref:DUF4258 domain-containing protein n=1 Tax=Tomitella fengzijianii TaxID=2597660 RepID=A0A516X0W7_9ACTN|nr:hypothetical protein [Tomitella fengzijianii]QDQ96722.1 hypothetical protein FO059_04400 [Tomitella fengzijianii]
MSTGPVIADSARRHAIDDRDIIHAFNHPMWFEELGDGLVMIIGPSRSAQMVEVGVVDSEAGPVIVHAMPARRKFLR